MNVFAQPQVEDPLWDRSTALQSVDRTQAMNSLRPLYEMARSGNETGLLKALSGIETDKDLPAPSRDYRVYSFTLGLGDMEADTVGPAVIGWLSNYQPATRVAHQDHPRMAVPLFNVRAAAQGVTNGWERQKASIEAERMLGGAPDQFISSYLAAGSAGRRGFIEALEFATPQQSAELSRIASDNLAESPELTLVAARAAMKSGNMELLRQSIIFGDGPGLSVALKEASGELSAEESAELLRHTIETGSASNAALAIALLAPATLDDPAVRDLMFINLANRDLGAAAALVLGGSTDPEIHSRLDEIASGDAGLEKQRAQLAISFRPAGGEG